MRQIAHPLRLFLKPIEQDPVAYAGGILCFSYLKCHEPAVCRDYRIRGLAAFLVVEVPPPRQIRNATGSRVTMVNAREVSRSHDTVIRVYDDAGTVIETHEHAGEFKEP
jgi:hypothetical protein